MRLANRYQEMIVPGLWPQRLTARWGLKTVIYECTLSFPRPITFWGWKINEKFMVYVVEKLNQLFIRLWSEQIGPWPQQHFSHLIGHQSPQTPQLQSVRYWRCWLTCTGHTSGQLDLSLGHVKPFEGGCQLGTVCSPSQSGSFGAIMKDLRIKE